MYGQSVPVFQYHNENFSLPYLKANTLVLKASKTRQLPAQARRFSL